MSKKHKPPRGLSIARVIPFPNHWMFVSILIVMACCAACDRGQHGVDRVPTAGASSQQEADSQEIQLVQSAGLGDPAKVDQLIQSGANVNYQDKLTGITPLIEAARFGRTNVVPLLLRSGADPNLCDRHGMTAMIHAITGGDKNADLVGMLLTAGANPFIADDRGSTSFDYAKALPPRPTILKILGTSTKQTVK